MCLTVKTTKDITANSKKEALEIAQSKIKVSARDIRVWKRFRINPDGSAETPYRETPVSKNGEVMTTKSFGFEIEQAYFFSGEPAKQYYAYVNRGIHAYTDFDSCEYEYDNECEIMVKCVIPAGTPYILGMCNEIAALQIIVPPFVTNAVEDHIFILY